MSTLAIVDDLGSSVCLERMRETGEHQGKKGAKLWVSLIPLLSQIWEESPEGWSNN
jgi:hypothetical protein